MKVFTYLEPLIDGHCTFWAKMVLAAATKDARIDTVRLVTNPTIADRLGSFTAKIGCNLEVIPELERAQMTSGSLFSRGRAQWRAARVAAAQGPVFLPFFDHAAVAAAVDLKRLPRGQRVSGIIFRPPNLFGLPRSPKNIADSFRRWATYDLAGRTCGGPLLTLDEVAPTSRIGKVSKSLNFLGDPSPNLNLTSIMPKIQNDGRKVVLLFGALTERKGIFQTLDAWRMLSDADNRKFKLRFVGFLGAEVQERFMVELKKLRIDTNAIVEIENSFISDKQLFHEIQNAAIILAPYQNHIGSSGVLHWAVAGRRSLIAQNTGLIGYQVERYRLGLAVDCTDPCKIARAISGVNYLTPDPTFEVSHSSKAFTDQILETMLAL